MSASTPSTPLGASDDAPLRDAQRPGARRRGRHARPKPRASGAGPRRHVRLTRRARILAASVVALVVVAAGVGWYEAESHPFGGPGGRVLVDVRPGEPFGAITSALSRHQVIGTALAFRLWSVVQGAPTVRPGTYQLRQNLSFSALSALLDAGPNVAELTVVPGMTVSEIGGELSSLPGKLAHAFLEAGRAGHVRSPFQPAPGGSLEGLIGSGTYQIMPGESGHALLARMVARFDAQARSTGLAPSTTVAGLDAYQLVTLASIVQKEGYFNRYMGDVARVVFNRLAGGMNLDMTSTVLYSLGKDGGKVTPADELVTTPYNTYLHAGLTPTPICTPSVQALGAALHPPAGPWLYFDLVTDREGIMKFASTYTQQLALVQEAAANAQRHASSGSAGAHPPGSAT